MPAKKNTIEPGDVFFTASDFEVRCHPNHAYLHGLKVYPGKIVWVMSKSERIMRDLLSAGKEK